MDVSSPCLRVADFVNHACRSSWAASGGLKLIIGNASVMVKPMPASEAGKVEIGNVGDANDVGFEVDCARDSFSFSTLED